MGATRIGCSNAVGAVLTEGADGTPTYGTVTPLKNLIKLSINPNASVDTLFADNGPMDTASTLGKIEVEMEKNELSTEEKAFLLGHSLDINGALVFGAEDVPPWVAIGFKTLKSNGTSKFIWLYKGKFVDPEESTETKGDTVNFQTDTIKGNFVKLDKSYTVAGKTVKPYKIELDEEHTGASEPAMAKWFDAVVLPGMSIV